MRSNTASDKSKKKRLLHLYRVADEGMFPALKLSQHVLAMSRRRYHDEDVVIIRHNGVEKIERVRAVQGTRFEVRADNPSKTTDSRQFGLIEKQAILGKIVWPRV